MSGYNYKVIIGEGCLFPAAIVKNKNTDCYEKQKALEESLIQEISPGDIVFTGNALYANFYPEWSERIFHSRNGKELKIDDAARIYSKRFVDFSKNVINKKGKVVLLVDSVQFPGLALPGELCTSEWFRFENILSKKCVTSMSSYLDLIEQYFGWRKNWEDGSTKFSFNAYKYAENCVGDECSAGHLYKDNNHYLPTYSGRLFSKFIADNPKLLNPVREGN